MALPCKKVEHINKAKQLEAERAFRDWGARHVAGGFVKKDLGTTTANLNLNCL